MIMIWAREDRSTYQEERELSSGKRSEGMREKNGWRIENWNWKRGN